MLTLLHETSWAHIHPHLLPALAVAALAGTGLLGWRLSRRPPPAE